MAILVLQLRKFMLAKAILCCCDLVRNSGSFLTFKGLGTGTLLAPRTAILLINNYKNLL